MQTGDLARCLGALATALATHLLATTPLVAAIRPKWLSSQARARA